ncbi:MAG: acylneuraminate cytidylyltransferase family protein [Coriobacteriia bacterium]
MYCACWRAARGPIRLYKDQSVLCVLPARAGSRQLPGKNMRSLAGRPLIQYAFETARACPEIDRIIVSTDSDEVADLARSMGLDVPFRRPAALAEDHVGTVDVLLHTMDYVEQEGMRYDVLVLMHATAPLCDVGDVTSCIRMLGDTSAGSVFSVTPAQRNPYFNMIEMLPDGTVHLCKEGSFATRQDAPAVYELNSAVYAWRWEMLRERKAVILSNSKVHIMPRERSVDIDDEIDLELAELLLARRPD